MKDVVMTPTAYLNSLESDVKKEMKQLHAIICKAVPKLKPFVVESGQSRFIRYGKFAYTTKSGCSGDWFVIGITARAHGLSLYVSCIYTDKVLYNKYKKLVPKADFGKSCIRLKKLSSIDEKILIQLIQDSEKEGRMGI